MSFTRIGGGNLATQNSIAAATVQRSKGILSPQMVQKFISNSSPAMLQLLEQSSYPSVAAPLMTDCSLLQLMVGLAMASMVENSSMKTTAKNQVTLMDLFSRRKNGPREK